MILFFLVTQIHSLALNSLIVNTVGSRTGIFKMFNRGERWISGLGRSRSFGEPGERSTDNFKAASLCKTRFRILLTYLEEKPDGFSGEDSP
jgi:hypothetical protein